MFQRLFCLLLCLPTPPVTCYSHCHVSTLWPWLWITFYLNLRKCCTTVKKKKKITEVFAEHLLDQKQSCHSSVLMNRNCSRLNRKRLRRVVIMIKPVWLMAGWAWDDIFSKISSSAGVQTSNQNHKKPSVAIGWTDGLIPAPPWSKHHTISVKWQKENSTFIHSTFIYAG